LPGRSSNRGRSSVGGEAAALEEGVLDSHAVLVKALRRAGVDADRRSLRVLPAGLTWDLDGPRLMLEFDLPPGAYATSVLRELVLTDPGTISKDR
jgi:tRNA pseudouridine13 synthase